MHGKKSESVNNMNCNCNPVNHEGKNTNETLRLLVWTQYVITIHDKSPVFTGSLLYFLSPSFELKLLLLAP